MARNIQIFTKLAYTYNQSLFITHKIHLNKILGFERKRERERMGCTKSHSSRYFCGIRFENHKLNKKYIWLAVCSVSIGGAVVWSRFKYRSILFTNIRKFSTDWVAGWLTGCT